jgi:hypothetical protein
MAKRHPSLKSLHILTIRGIRGLHFRISANFSKLPERCPFSKTAGFHEQETFR